jgi:hypothetical protein
MADFWAWTSLLFFLLHGIPCSPHFFKKKKSLHCTGWIMQTLNVIKGRVLLLVFSCFVCVCVCVCVLSLFVNKFFYVIFFVIFQIVALSRCLCSIKQNLAQYKCVPFEWFENWDLEDEGDGALMAPFGQITAWIFTSTYREILTLFQDS